MVHACTVFHKTWQPGSPLFKDASVYAGDTYLMRDINTQEMLAVKLIPRPIPKAIIPEHVFREIKVCACLYLSPSLLRDQREHHKATLP